MKPRTPFVHVAFRSPTFHELLDDEHAPPVWHRLRAVFPDTLAATLMPNHGHLIVRDAPSIRRRLAGILAQTAPRCGAIWSAVPPPERIADSQKLLRQIKYVLLNPTRARLTDDPLRWTWSTYRDVMGAIADPWVRIDAIGDAMGWPPRGREERFHRYVSSDWSTAMHGTPRPCAELPRHPSLDAIHAAVVAATRAPAGRPLDARSRRLFLHVATSFGWTSAPRIAAVAGCSERTIRRMRSAGATQDGDAVRAVRTCLADMRIQGRGGT